VYNKLNIEYRYPNTRSCRQFAFISACVQFQKQNAVFGYRDICWRPQIFKIRSIFGSFITLKRAQFSGKLVFFECLFSYLWKRLLILTGYVRLEIRTYKSIATVNFVQIFHCDFWLFFWMHRIGYSVYSKLQFICVVCCNVRVVITFILTLVECIVLEYFVQKCYFLQLNKPVMRK
jgi:hypothetical protein